MTRTARDLLGRVLYALLFVGVVPAALVAWARATEARVPLPPVHAPPAGIALAAGGLALLLGGMWGLLRHGGGLPMNAFPPPRYVSRGLYGLVAHPIYVGFGALVLGAALTAGSSSGLWLVTPVTWLAMTALVLGYERPDLRRRFGGAVRAPRLLGLPEAADRPPRPRERLAALAQVAPPAVAAWAALRHLGLLEAPGLDAGPAWAVGPRLAAAAVVVAAPLVAPTARALRRFAVAGAWAVAVTAFLAIVLPWAPDLLLMLALLAGAAWPRRLRLLSRAGVIAGASAAGLAGGDSLVAVVGAVVLAVPLHRYERTWARLRAWTEAVANGWREWRLGPVRILNRALPIGLGGLVGLTGVGLALGPARATGMLLVGVVSLVGAAVWAQWVEGSSVLLRPFGFYGGLLGGLAGTALAWALGYDPVVLLAGFGVGLPFAQAFGRLGCLINGCCHGGRCAPEVGIRYRHTRSRVTRIAGLVNVPLYPTQLYSLLSNLAVGAVLARLWFGGASPTLVLGLYYVLTGLARFVEESYRDEPQTPTVWGLHVYHWLAVLSVLGGAAATLLPAASPAVPFHPPTPGLIASVVGLAALGAGVMGVDFPTSNRRFSRLAPADGPVGLVDVEEDLDEAA